MVTPRERLNIYLGILFYTLLCISVYFLMRDALNVSVQLFGRLSPRSATAIQGVVLQDGIEVYRAPLTEDAYGIYYLFIPNEFGYSLNIPETNPSSSWGEAQLGDVISLDNPAQKSLQLITFRLGNQPQCTIQIVDVNSYICNPTVIKRLSKQVEFSLDTIIVVGITAVVSLLYIRLSAMKNTSSDKSTSQIALGKQISYAAVFVYVLAMLAVFVTVIVTLTWSGSQLNIVLSLVAWTIGLMFMLPLIVAVLVLLGVIAGERGLEFLFAVLEKIPIVNSQLSNFISSVAQWIRPPSNE